MDKEENISIKLEKNYILDLLHKTMNEILNEDLSYDEDTKNIFTEEEFKEVTENFKLYGTLFGTLFIDRLIENFSKMLLEKEKEN